MFIIARLAVRYFIFLIFWISFASFSAEEVPGDKPKYKISDDIYLLLNEKSAIKNITRKNNQYTRTSLLRLLEINGELTSFYIEVEDPVEINIIYNESYEIIEYLRNFNRETEFYSAGLVRFGYILYKIKEYKSCLEYLDTAKASKYLIEDNYVFAVKIAAQVQYELGNYENVINQFQLIKKDYYDKLDDDLLLVYSKALLKRKNFTLAYSTLSRFIKSVEKKKKGFTSTLLDNIHVFFVEANQFDAGINFLSRYAPQNLPRLTAYIIERSKGIERANKAFKRYAKLENDYSQFFSGMLIHLKQLRLKGLYRHMTYFFKIGAKIVSRRRRLDKAMKKDFINLMLLTYADHVKHNITPIYTKRLAFILKDITSGLEAHLDFVMAKQYFRYKEFRKAYRYFDQAYRLSSSDYVTKESLIPKRKEFEINKPKMVHVSLDYMYLIYSEKVDKLLNFDDSKDFLEEYNKDHPKGKYTHKVFLSLIKIYLDESEYTEASVVIKNYLDRFPNNIDVYRQPIADLMDSILKEQDPRKQDAFLAFIQSEDFQNKIFSNANNLNKLAKAEFLFSLNLFPNALRLIKQVELDDFKTPEEKNRYLLYSSRIHLKNVKFKQASRQLIQYISRARIKELDKYAEIIVEAMEEFYHLQDVKTPYTITKKAFKRINQEMRSFPLYISSLLFAFIMNKKNEEYIDFIKNNTNLFDKTVVNEALVKSIDFLLLDKNFDMLLTFLKSFAPKIKANFQLVERIKLKYHEFIIKNKKKSAEKFKNFLVDITTFEFVIFYTTPLKKTLLSGILELKTLRTS
jgi:outer membrane protein assembly factor BamD (BamD/ComL family)